MHLRVCVPNYPLHGISSPRRLLEMVQTIWDRCAVCPVETRAPVISVHVWLLMLVKTRCRYFRDIFLHLGYGLGREVCGEPCDGLRSLASGTRRYSGGRHSGLVFRGQGPGCQQASDPTKLESHACQTSKQNLRQILAAFYSGFNEWI